MKPKVPPISEIEQRIKSKTANWEGNCYGIAKALVEAKIVRGHAIYGHWLGPISDNSFFAARKDIGWVQHGWILCKDKWVVDPTRWVFEAVDPYIYIGHPDEIDPKCPDFEPAEDDPYMCMHCNCPVNDHEVGFFRPCKICGPIWPYDEGGNLLKRMNLKPAPVFDHTSERMFNMNQYLTSEIVDHIKQLLHDPHDRDYPLLYSKEQLFWLANLPYDMFGKHVWEIYKAFRRLKLDQFIPMDNYTRAKREYTYVKRR